MSWSVIPHTKIRTEKEWKTWSLKPGKKYRLWLRRGNGLILNEKLQPIMIYRGALSKAKRKRDWLFKLVWDKDNLHE
jgi:hypothetical protein